MEQSQDITPEILGKIRQLKRLILSRADFKHAHLVASYILDSNLHNQAESETHVILPALNCSMIMAYCRPFSGNSNDVPDLPGRLLSVLNEDEKIVHRAALADRMKVLAHSDADGLELELVVADFPGAGPMLVPIVNWGLAPLKREAVEVLVTAVKKLMGAVVYERSRMEPELMPYLQKVHHTKIHEY
jgi:hypothetical protein